MCVNEVGKYDGIVTSVTRLCDIPDNKIATPMVMLSSIRLFDRRLERT